MNTTRAHARGSSRIENRNTANVVQLTSTPDRGAYVVHSPSRIDPLCTCAGRSDNYPGARATASPNPALGETKRWLNRDVVPPKVRLPWATVVKVHVRFGGTVYIKLYCKEPRIVDTIPCEVKYTNLFQAIAIVRIQGIITTCTLVTDDKALTNNVSRHPA
jgi:hypothetical protein